MKSIAQTKAEKNLVKSRAFRDGSKSDARFPVNEMKNPLLKRLVALAEKARPGSTTAWLALKNVSDNFKAVKISEIVAGDNAALPAAAPAPRSRATARTQLPISHASSDFDPELIASLKSLGLLPDSPAPSNRISPPMPPATPARPEPAGEMRPAVPTAPAPIPASSAKIVAEFQRLTKSADPRENALASRLYLKDPTAFLEACQDVARFEKSPLEKQREAEAQAVDQLRKFRGWK